MSEVDGLLTKSLFACSETFFDKSKACSRRCQNSPWVLNLLISLVFRFAKVDEKNVSTDGSKEFWFGQQPVKV
jgi:hypothetical protein